MTTPSTLPEKCPHCGSESIRRSLIFECETMRTPKAMRARPCYERELAAFRAELAEAKRREQSIRSAATEICEWLVPCRVYDSCPACALRLLLKDEPLDFDDPAMKAERDRIDHLFEPLIARQKAESERDQLLARNAALRGALEGIKSELQSVIEWSYPDRADQSTPEGRWHVAASGFHEKWRSEIQTALDGTRVMNYTP